MFQHVLCLDNIILVVNQHEQMFCYISVHDVNLTIPEIIDSHFFLMGS